eukprot:GHVR01050824.1.p1 GENE.GHVR01050824.1~~GHVR01050824.1.p1  ORF type:complete len:455 (-),score=72.72 GHVR01050824.1:416-1780(-)
MEGRVVTLTNTVRVNDESPTACSLQDVAAWHVFNFVATVFVVLCILSIVAYRTLNGIFIAALIVSYLLYAFESFWLSSVARDLWLVKNQTPCNALLRTLKNNPPSLHFRVQCFHFENVMVRVKGKTGRTDEHVVRKRVNTYSETDKFAYGSWTDDSDSIVGLKNFGVVNLTLTKSLHFLDRETEDSVKECFEALQQRNRNRDEQMDADMWTAMPGFSEKSPLMYGDTDPPMWMSFLCYTICTLLLLSWPFRILFEVSTGDLTYNVRKSISIYDELPEGMKTINHPIKVTASRGRSSVFVVFIAWFLIVCGCACYLLFPREPTVCGLVRWRGGANSYPYEFTPVMGTSFKCRLHYQATLDNLVNLHKVQIIGATAEVGITLDGKPELLASGDLINKLNTVSRRDKHTQTMHIVASLVFLFFFCIILFFYFFYIILFILYLYIIFILLLFIFSSLK